MWCISFVDGPRASLGMSARECQCSAQLLHHPCIHTQRLHGRSAGAGLDPRATDTYRPPPPPLLPPFAAALSTVSTQPTTLPATRYTSTRFPNPQRGLPEG